MIQRREIGLKLEGELRLEEDFGTGTMKDVLHPLGTRGKEKGGWWENRGV